MSVRNRILVAKQDRRQTYDRRLTFPSDQSASPMQAVADLVFLALGLQCGCYRTARGNAYHATCFVPYSFRYALRFRCH